MGNSDPSYDPGAASHRALREIRRELNRHPAVLSAEGFPPNTYSRVEATVDPSWFGRAAESATLTVRWFAGESPGDPPQFSVHYSEESGLDCGWHREPNPHVAGLAHYQERPDPETSYSYEPIEFSSHVPARVVWDVLDRLGEHLDG